MAAMSLAVLSISKKVDRDGKVIEPVVRYTDTMIRRERIRPPGFRGRLADEPIFLFPSHSHHRIRRSHPKAFDCNAKPRLEKARQMIASADL
jgi:hypothetical protein